MKLSKRVSALVVALIMLFSLFSISVSAWGTNEGIEVYWNNSYVATVTYDDMDTAISQTSDVTYAGINNYGTYKSYTGKVYTLDQLLTAVGKASDWAAAADTTTVSLITPLNETADYTKAQLTETRYYYDASGSIVSSVPVGFMKRTSGTDSYFKFVFGQTAKTEKYVPKFWDLTVTGNTKIHFFPNGTPTQVGEIYAYKNGTDGPYSSGAAIHAQPGDVIHFNYSDTTYLNSTMIYYTTGDFFTPAAVPGCNDSSINYIKQTPAYGGQYNGFVCNSSSVWNEIKVIGIRYGYTDSNVATFEVQVSNW